MSINENGYGWIDYVNTESNNVTLYPIQLANCERLRKNKVVYIFDEVGSGKTISSGLMALDYLYTNPDKNVLIITTKALTTPDKNDPLSYGQFLTDWYKKLPFEQLGLTERIQIINNNDARINNHVKEYGGQYGLIIIDEAHYFVSKKSNGEPIKRYNNLTTMIRAEKVVFLTATPIKNSADELYIYPEIAACLLYGADKVRKEYVHRYRGEFYRKYIAQDWKENNIIQAHYRWSDLVDKAEVQIEKLQNEFYVQLQQINYELKSRKEQEHWEQQFKNYQYYQNYQQSLQAQKECSYINNDAYTDQQLDAIDQWLQQSYATIQILNSQQCLLEQIESTLNLMQTKSDLNQITSALKNVMCFIDPNYQHQWLSLFKSNLDNMQEAIKDWAKNTAYLQSLEFHDLLTEEEKELVSLTSWIEDLYIKEKDKLICNRFNTDIPVTRYFKDTIRALCGNHTHASAIREPAQVWGYVRSDRDCTREKAKLKCLLTHIQDAIKEDAESRFLIYTRLIEDEANRIDAYLKSEGKFVTWNEETEDINTCLLVNGSKNCPYKITDFTRKLLGKTLPKVIIVTYQLAEEGVNLQEYNYVINYNIPATPYRLEQRFGRIDRISGNGGRKIYNCFLLALRNDMDNSTDYSVSANQKDTLDYMDTNTTNFHSAMLIYMKELLSFLPSKNTLLTKEILKKCAEDKEYREHINHIRSLCDDKNICEEVLAVVQSGKSDDDSLSSEGKALLNMILTDIKFFHTTKTEKSEYWTQDQILDSAADLLRHPSRIKERLSGILASVIPDELIQKFNQFSGDLRSNQIIYKKDLSSDKEKIQDNKKDSYSDVSETDFISIKDCINDIQDPKKNPEYQKYLNCFEELTKNCEVLCEVRKKIPQLNQYFEEKFLADDFDAIFEPQTCADGLKKVCPDFDFSKYFCFIKEDIPFFKMCRDFKRLYLKNIYVGGSRSYIALRSTIQQLNDRLHQKTKAFGLSADFCCAAFQIPTDLHTDDYGTAGMMISINDAHLNVGRWLKLIYHLTKNEQTYCVDKDKDILPVFASSRYKYLFQCSKLFYSLVDVKNRDSSKSPIDPKCDVQYLGRYNQNSDYRTLFDQLMGTFEENGDNRTNEQEKYMKSCKLILEKMEAHDTIMDQYTEELLEELKPVFQCDYDRICKILKRNR